MIPEVTQIHSCRLCKSPDLTPLFSLGNQYVSDFVDPKVPKESVQCPINLVLCNCCTLVQLEHTAPQEILYSHHYWYRSGVTDTMRAALRDVTAKAESLVELEAGDVVLDIGSNDGTLLNSYSVSDLVRVGVEPASNMWQYYDDSVYLISDFWGAGGLVEDFVTCHHQAKVITAIGMFYDLEDPLTFVTDIAKALADDGIFIAQLMCLQDMLDINDIGNFAHEHLEFYSFTSLLYLFDKAGLEIIDLETNNVNGKSTRIIARKKGSSVGTVNQDALEERAASEQGLDDPDIYQEWFRQLERNRLTLTRFVKRAVSEGKKVWVYGASTKGNVILQYCGLGGGLLLDGHDGPCVRLIEAAADRSPEKWGLQTVGTGIPIVSEEEFRKAAPEFAIMLPYAFEYEMARRESEWLSNGGTFIIPLPEFRLVGAAS